MFMLVCFKKINIIYYFIIFFVTELYFVSVLKEPIPYQTLNIELKMKKSNCDLKEVVLHKYFRMTFFRMRLLVFEQTKKSEKLGSRPKKGPRPKIEIRLGHSYFRSHRESTYIPNFIIVRLQIKKSEKRGLRPYRAKNDHAPWY